MFEFCGNTDSFSNFQWYICYLTTPKHFAFYRSFGTVLLIVAIVAPISLTFGLISARNLTSKYLIFRGLANIYVNLVRGIPDIAIFLFFVIALDQGIEFIVHQVRCPDWEGAIWVGNEFRVCALAKVPSSAADQWVHDMYAFATAAFTFSLVFGAFAGNVLGGAIEAVPRDQTEAASAFGLTEKQTFRRIVLPQMWVIALPGLSNLWLILVKATPLLFLLGIEDIVYWARELGGTKQARFTDFPHGDYRLQYFIGLFVFYIAFTLVSEAAFRRFKKYLSRGSVGTKPLSEVG